MSSRLLFQPDRKQAPVSPQQSGGTPRILIMVIIGVVGLLFLGLLAVPALVGTDLFFAAGAGCSGQQTGTVGQPTAGAKARAIPADYLSWYKKVGRQYGVPWAGAAGNVWGGAPVHPAGEVVNGVATDEDGGPTASVYDPADAIAGAAKYLLEFQVQTNPAGAVF